MLKTQIIINVWRCDSCGLEKTSEENPYFRLNIQSIPYHDPCEIDLCPICIQQINASVLTDYIANNVLMEAIVADKEID